MNKVLMAKSEFFPLRLPVRVSVELKGIVIGRSIDGVGRVRYDIQSPDGTVHTGISEGWVKHDHESSCKCLENTDNKS